jgi:DNA polymerase-3 subunit epsilon
MKMYPELSDLQRFTVEEVIENTIEAEKLRNEDLTNRARSFVNTVGIVNNISKLTELNNKSKNADLAGRIVFNTDGHEVFSFGKHKDKLVEDVFKKEPSYYSWMMSGDFPLYTKKIITKIRLRTKK